MGSPISAYGSDTPRAPVHRRILRVFHLLVLCAGTALVTHGLLAWRLNAFRLDEVTLGDPAVRSVVLLALGVVLVPVSLLELFHLDADDRRDARARSAPGSGGPSPRSGGGSGGEGDPPP